MTVMLPSTVSHKELVSRMISPSKPAAALAYQRHLGIGLWHCVVSRAYDTYRSPDGHLYASASFHSKSSIFLSAILLYAAT